MDKNNILLLRFPFSVFLLPVFCFALSQSENIHLVNSIIIFIVLHILIFPASNGYNSYMDQDETSIGGLRNPPKPTRKLFYITLIFDIVGLLLCQLINFEITLLVLLFILASRAYSYRKIRLKKYPFTSFIIVAIFQGGLVYFISFLSITNSTISETLTNSTVLSMMVSSLLIGATYPLTQVYQHQSDIQNGDRTLSYVLGYKGTFIFSAILFLVANVVLYYYFYLAGNLFHFFVFQLFMIPILIYFLQWSFNVFKNEKAANYDNTMLMNGITAFCMIACFISLMFL